MVAKEAKMVTAVTTMVDMGAYKVVTVAVVVPGRVVATTATVEWLQATSARSEQA